MKKGKTMQVERVRAAVAVFGLCAAIAMAPAVLLAQSGAVGRPGAAKVLPSPPATATTKLDGKEITIKYNAPSARGRTIFGTVVPYGKVWRTGANPATTLVTAGHVAIGNLDVPAGTYTIYSLPSQSDAWLLIVNKQTGQWGTEYSESQDLGRTPMTANALSSPQETMSLSFENTKGKTTELHIKWEKTDEFVTLTAK